MRPTAAVVFVLIATLSCGWQGVLRATEYTPTDSVQNKNMLTEKHGFYAGLLMPGASLGYRYHCFRFESRFYSGDDFEMIGGRVAYDFYVDEVFSFYTGLEAYRTKFEGLITEGEGILHGTMLGLQYFLAENFSFEIDYVLARSEMRDDYSSVETGELVHYMNLGVSYHL